MPTAGQKKRQKVRGSLTPGQKARQKVRDAGTPSTRLPRKATKKKKTT